MNEGGQQELIEGEEIAALTTSSSPPYALPEPTFHSYFKERVCSHWSCETYFCYHDVISQPSEEYGTMVRTTNEFNASRDHSMGIEQHPGERVVSDNDCGDCAENDDVSGVGFGEERLPQHENRWSLRSSISEKTHEVEQYEIEVSVGRRGVYAGTLDRSNNPHGQGRLDFEDGTVYEGSWINGDFSGFGKLTDPAAGTVYEGGFFDNFRHGCGVLHFADGKIFDGNFKFGKFGKGRLKFPDGSQFWGHVSEDGSTPHGRGKYNYSDGRVFDGEFQNGIRQGHGRMTWPGPEGRWYLGEWSEGEKHGLGMEVKADGTLLFEGIFNKGVPVESSSFPEIKHSDEANSVLLYRSSNACCANTLVGPMPQRICMRKKLHVPLVNYSD